LRLIYFDECKFNPPTQPFYWLGGISICSNDAAEIEAKVSDLAQEYFGNRRLARETEFHAKDIIHGKAQFRGWSIEKRLECLGRLASIVGNDERIRKFEIQIEVGKMFAAKSIEDKAFMFLIEKIQIDTKALQEECIVIGDFDGDFADGSVANLSRFRETGTDYEFAREIDRIIDSVYFIHSHHSRLLQLADIYTYCLQLEASPHEGGYPRRKLKEIVRQETQLHAAQRYKRWPS
jgi:hypothetical protein